MAASKPLSSSIPFELVEEILYKTPVKSLLRFKSTCKRWCALLNDKRFIHKHLDLSHQQFIALESSQIFNPVNQALLDLHVNVPSDMNTVIHCDGLLLCLCERSSLAVWNPLLSQVKWIHQPSSSNTKPIQDFGIGYDNNACRDNYKILMTHTSQEYTSNLMSPDYTVDIEIYEFKSRLWRSVGSTKHGWWVLCLGISMSGNMYWIANQMIKANSEIETTFTPYSETETFIQSFDFSKEIFKPICFAPIKYNHSLPGQKVVFSGFEGDRLSLLHQDKDVKIDVWVTNKVTDEVVSWSKYFNVTFPDLPRLYSSFYNRPPYFIHETNAIMLGCEENNYGCLYEIGKSEIKRNQVEIGRSKWKAVSKGTRFSIYVPSLVPVPE